MIIQHFTITWSGLCTVRHSIPSAQGGSSTCSVAPIVFTSPHNKEGHLPKWAQPGTFVLFLPKRRVFIRRINISECGYPGMEVKVYRAEGNGWIACSSTRGGMSLAGGNCKERRAELRTCHGCCIRTALRSLPRQSAFLSIGRGKSRWY